MTDFPLTPNNVSSKVGPAGYTAASGTLALVAGDGAKFPTLTAGQWLRVTVIRRAVAYSPVATSSDYTIFKVTGKSGDHLTIDSAIEGTTDRNYAADDVVECRLTGFHLADLQGATNALETTVAGHTSSIATNAADIATNAAAILALQADDATTVHTTGSYADPAWITSLAGTKLTGTVVATNGVVTTTSYANPSWITSLAGSKVSGDIAGNAGSITGSIAESQVTNLPGDLAALAPKASPSFTGDVTLAVAGLYHVHLGGATKNTVFLGLVPGVMAAGDFLIFGSYPTAITGTLFASNVTMNASADVQCVLKNANNSSAAAHARWELTVGGASGGDPKFVYTISGIQNWAHGIDNSDGDKWKLSAGDTLGTGDTIIADPVTLGTTFAGKVTAPGRDGPIQATTDAATTTFDFSLYDRRTVTLGGNRTLAVTGDTVGQQFTVLITQDAIGSRTVTWWSGIKWSGGTAPTLTTAANKTDVFTFLKTGSGAYLGFLAGVNF